GERGNLVDGVRHEVRRAGADIGSTAARTLSGSLRALINRVPVFDHVRIIAPDARALRGSMRPGLALGEMLPVGVCLVPEPEALEHRPRRFADVVLALAFRDRTLRLESGGVQLGTRGAE